MVPLSRRNPYSLGRSVALVGVLHPRPVREAGFRLSSLELCTHALSGSVPSQTFPIPALIYSTLYSTPQAIELYTAVSAEILISVTAVINHNHSLRYLVRTGVCYKA